MKKGSHLSKENNKKLSLAMAGKAAWNKSVYNQGEQIGACIFIKDTSSRSSNYIRFAIFQCKCGKLFESAISEVKRGDTTSCGCGWSKGNRKPVSEETKRKLRLANLGNVPSVETRKKISEAWKGKKHSLETKNRMSKSAKFRWGLSDDEVKVRDDVRKTVHSLVSRILSNKSARSVNILGYSYMEFRQHIESLFVEGMSWNNRKEWQIDHIVPINWFMKNEIYDVRIICSLKNLQPLWSVDNRKKWYKFDPIANREFLDELLNTKTA